MDMNGIAPLAIGLVCMVMTAAPTGLPAQVQNGSFESAGQFSLAGWEWTCSDPGQLTGGAPGCGAFAVSKEPGQTQGCFPSYIYQRLTGVQHGDLLTFSAWMRCGPEPNCLGASIGLGRITNGTFTLGDMFLTYDTVWTYLSVTDTVELGSGDTAVIVLNPGLIGGPVWPATAWFDGVSVSMAVGVQEYTAPSVVLFPDPVETELRISSITPMRELEVTDLEGRIVLRATLHGTVMSTVDSSALAAGGYVARVRTDAGTVALRFVKR